MEAEKVAATRGDAEALVDNLPDPQAEVEAETLRDKLSDALALVDTLADLS